jgi:hypothetical protein
MIIIRCGKRKRLHVLRYSSIFLEEQNKTNEKCLYSLSSEAFQNWRVLKAGEIHTLDPGPAFAHGTTGAKRTVGTLPPPIHKNLKKKSEAL